MKVRLPHIQVFEVGGRKKNLVVIEGIQFCQVGKQILQVGLAAVRRRREPENGDLHYSSTPGAESAAASNWSADSPMNIESISVMSMDVKSRCQHAGPAGALAGASMRAHRTCIATWKSIM